MRQFDKNDYLKTRHFISLDHVQAEQKNSITKKENSGDGKKLKTFYPTGEQIHELNGERKSDIFTRA